MFEETLQGIARDAYLRLEREFQQDVIRDGRSPIMPMPPHEDQYALHQQDRIHEEMNRTKATVSVNAPVPDIIGPTRASTFPEDAKGRKQRPVASGVLDYFPDAIVAIAQVSWTGNEQHNPGQPLHWARNKSSDEADAMMRHFLQRGQVDSDGIRHSAKMVWRALALLQKEIEEASKRIESEPEYRRRMGFDTVDNTPDGRYNS